MATAVLRGTGGWAGSSTCCPSHAHWRTGHGGVRGTEPWGQLPGGRGATCLFAAGPEEQSEALPAPPQVPELGAHRRSRLGTDCGSVQSPGLSERQALLGKWKVSPNQSQANTVPTAGHARPVCPERDGPHPGWSLRFSCHLRTVSPPAQGPYWGDRELRVSSIRQRRCPRPAPPPQSVRQCVIPLGNEQSPASRGGPSVPAGAPGLAGPAAPTLVALPGRPSEPTPASSLSGMNPPRPCPMTCFLQWNIRVEKYLFWRREMAATPKVELWVAKCAPKGSVLGR